MTTATKPEIVKLAPNVPVEIKVKYADIVEGQYGTQIRLKGENQAGATISIYVPIDCSSALLSAGAVEGKNEKGEFYTLPRGVDWWVVEKQQAAGEKYGHVTLTPKGASAPPPPRAPAPTPPPTAPSTVETPHLVGLYDDTLRHVLRIVAKVNAGPDPVVVFTATEVAAMTATLFIARSREA